MDKEIETTATEESKEEPDEEKSKDEHPEGVEQNAVYKKRYDDLKGITMRLSLSTKTKSKT